MKKIKEFLLALCGLVIVCLFVLLCGCADSENLGLGIILLGLMAAVIEISNSIDAEWIGEEESEKEKD